MSVLSRKTKAKIGVKTAKQAAKHPKLALEGAQAAVPVVKAGGKYVLQTTDSAYQLDDQDKAKQFVGQQVKINGNLDSSTSMIHISDIGPIS